KASSGGRKESTGEGQLMGWHNPPMSWADLEQTLSGERTDAGSSEAPLSRKRVREPAPEIIRPAGAAPYAELHAHSSFSFLDGASSPEDLLAEAASLGLTALAITDHDGFYGAARFAEAAEHFAVQTVYGAELTLDLPAR